MFDEKSQLDLSFDNKEVITLNKSIEIKCYLINKKNMLEKEAIKLLHTYFRIDNYYIVNKEDVKKTISLNNYKQKKELLQFCGFSIEEIKQRTIEKYKVSLKEYKVKYH